MTVSIKRQNVVFEIEMSDKEFGNFASAVDVICMNPILIRDEKAARYLTQISEFKNNMVMALNQ